MHFAANWHLQSHCSPILAVAWRLLRSLKNSIVKRHGNAQTEIADGQQVSTAIELLLLWRDNNWQEMEEPAG